MQMPHGRETGKENILCTAQRSPHQGTRDSGSPPPASVGAGAAGGDGVGFLQACWAAARIGFH